MPPDFRFRLHDKTMPGKPDIVFPRYGAVIMAQGCFSGTAMTVTFSNCHRHAQSSGARRSTATARTTLGRVLRWQKQAGDRPRFWECALKGRTRLSHDEVIGTCGQWLQSDAVQLEIRGQ